MITDDIKRMLYDNYISTMKFYGKEKDIFTYDKWLKEVFNNIFLTL